MGSGCTLEVPKDGDIVNEKRIVQELKPAVGVEGGLRFAGDSLCHSQTAHLVFPTIWAWHSALAPYPIFTEKHSNLDVQFMVSANVPLLHGWS